MCFICGIRTVPQPRPDDNWFNYKCFMRHITERLTFLARQLRPPPGDVDGKGDRTTEEVLGAFRKYFSKLSKLSTSLVLSLLVVDM